jgi:CDP-diacylglycerol--glycerol-3-phosphate 3-phosphatidyltransferase
VTWAAFILSVAAALLLILLAPSRASSLILPAALFLRMALNAVDGMLAREHGLAPRLGTVLNEMGDVLSDGALYVALVPALAPLGAAPWATSLFAMLAVATEAAGLQAIQVGAARRYDGPMGKSDRAAAIGLLGSLLALGLPSGAWLTLLFASLSALSLLTLVNRCRAALREPRP